ncbi:RrF2 family transcriptional regulator [Acinetobacter sp. ANC 3832]|uniref:RrF2 family transcriptional regulator n=1 Tax=Acinetobacter sp. ANC 3832 TaxID=1977874 RepID=UPI000A33FB35|nr:Rrf2 family transcriptional regulator [Acinetobacter sp. ANC 3832]OTG95492.1 transcriptional regulator [Acinetobacter sp. ANC 3832]
MQLNKFTDYGFRLLLYLSQTDARESYTIAQIADDLQISQNHLVKIVHHFSKKGWVITTRGKGGGVQLAPHSLGLRVGDVIADLEANTALVECNVPPCVLRMNCNLKGHLDKATKVFYDYLNQYTLGQMIRKNKTDYLNKIDLQNL